MAGYEYILVVEDCTDARASLLTLLEIEGFSALGAGNGQEAIAVMERHGPPWLILLDLAMPVMDGRCFYRWLSRFPALASIPVILHSGEVDLPEIAAALQVSDYAPKAAEPAALLQSIHRWRRTAKIRTEAPELSR